MSAYIREIVTLQIGHYSNFIGTHWLNLQESNFVYELGGNTDINNDYLFRDGLLPNRQECYIPRILILDAKGCLGSLSQAGTLYDAPILNPSESHAAWPGSVNLVCQDAEERNEFLKYLEKEDEKFTIPVDEDKDVCSDEPCQPGSPDREQKVFDLKNKVKVWSNFLRPHLHPKAIYILEDVVHQDVGMPRTGGIVEEEDLLSPSGWGFQEGVAVMRRESTLDEVTDRIRLLAESCGSMQGFQLLCDVHDGMGGVGAAVAEHLADAYASKDLFTFASAPPYCKPDTTSQMSLHYSNMLQSYSELSKYSSILHPLHLRNSLCQPKSDVVRWPYTTYREDCPYESSSILAAYLDTITVPYRSKSDAIPMSILSDMLTPLHRKVVGGSLSFPLGIEEDVFFRDWLMENMDGKQNVNEKMRFRPVGGSADLEMPKIAELSAIRGISKSKLESGRKRVKFDNAWHSYDDFLRRDDQTRERSVCRLVGGVTDPIKTTTPFPQIFSSNVNCDGFLKQTLDQKENIIGSVPAIANMYQGDGIKDCVRNLWRVGSKINVAKLSKLITGDLETDSWKETLENVSCLVQCYEDPSSNFSHETDSD